jgi:hypothetical protein
MTERDSPTLDPERLLQIKQDIYFGWQELPYEQRATVALTLFGKLLAEPDREWMFEALARQRHREPANEAHSSSTSDLQAESAPELLDGETRDRLPLPFTPEGESYDALAQVKLAQPGGQRVWYVSAFDRDDLCFGLIVETDISYDYFSLSDLERLRDPTGHPLVQRDPTFTPTALRDLQERHEGLLTTAEQHGMDRESTTDTV